MTNEERIKQFEQQNPPFMLYDHKNAVSALAFLSLSLRADIKIMVRTHSTDTPLKEAIP